MTKTTIVLIRQDLRLHDHPALYHASKEGLVIPLYIHDESMSPPGEARKWWLHRNLEQYEKSLEAIGGCLLFDKGKLEEVLPKWVKKTEAAAVYWNRLYAPDIFERDKKLAEELAADGIEVKTFEGTLLLPPWKITKADGSPYKVYTSYYKAIRKVEVPKPVPTVKSLSAPEIAENEMQLEDFRLLPQIRWYKIMEKVWDPGEKAAIKRMKRFSKQVQDYDEGRDYPAAGIHSTLSPYLAIGAVSVRSLFHHFTEKIEKQTEPFIKQLIWRDFSYSVLMHFPQSPEEPLHEKFKAFQWEENAAHWESWIKGRTGYPIVDAGMRELWATGFMHNRVRMIAASFLTKHLLIPWQKGADWFMDTLIDADTANNSMGWQWVAGSGFDSSPYFRIFNPTLQSEKFDGEGEYIRMWVPELKDIPSKYIHSPSTAPTDVLEESGVKLGVDYPYPVVDHKAARQRALDRFEEIK
ncbi:deoxyribodipyrimidine photolyase [[Bacillus] enclensis]|uniref:Deoxyribodipyrimidine photo-lyase n=1 Tax=[Bacillus] enclensis TaxID=1402860 RepID=A0A0V8HAX9_9BACI|nr:deoxyribodipyrimidine photo-lyase [[Bacillus] enclensis]KSU59472.1 deoxyribodipyrimidine photolyase [[Bacillus] enclensis]SCC30999.1 deoxyribodipyrimidine photo-lyase [[Bacillus] enclensis]